MRKFLVYFLVVSWLLAFVDWQSVHLTRWVHRDWLDWMHQHEKTYALLTRTGGLIACTPCMAFKPLFYFSMQYSQASQEERDAITHAPAPSWTGFYVLLERGTSWTFVPWIAWFVFWTGPSAIWFLIVRRVRRAL